MASFIMYCSLETNLPVPHHFICTEYSHDVAPDVLLFMSNVCTKCLLGVCNGKPFFLLLGDSKKQILSRF